MAKLESIRFTPMRETVQGDMIHWELDKLGRKIDNLPQIFWDSAEPWSEANHWALTKALSTVGGNIKTVLSLMKHLAVYASWLESTGMDWRHFPMRMSDRAVVQFRGELIWQRDTLGTLAPSTATSRMAAVIQFYRHAQIYGFVKQSSPMWKDRRVLHRFFDLVGFERTMLRISSELAIPNRARLGEKLEDGLLPLRPEHSTMLLEFTREAGLRELHLMLSIGLLTGARLGTISTLGVRNIEGALPDDSMLHFYRVPVGPGTGVATKFNVSGHLLVPDFLMDALKGYAYSMQRLRRQALASEVNRGRLFLTVRGNPYEAQSFNRLMTDLRHKTVAAGLRFMEHFKFHQTRATFGTMLMGAALDVTTAKNAVAFVCSAMLHKNESTTMRYVRFVQNVPVKALISAEYTAIFSGIVNRNWSQFHA